MLFVSRRMEENPPKSTASPALEKIAVPVSAPLPPAPTPPVILPVTAEAAQLNDPELTAGDDLAILTTLLHEYRRHLGGNPTGDNLEIAAALRGVNSKALACLPAGPGTYLDNAGRLIDRWGTPYFFHALSGTEMEILSAGPDGEFHTDDDIRAAN
jgi:hypothetical protein